MKVNYSQNFVYYGILFTVIVCPLFICNYFDGNFTVAKQVLFQWMVLSLFSVAFFCYEFALFSQQKKSLFWTIFVFFCYCFLHSFLSPNPFVALFKTIFYLCCLLFFILLCKFFYRDKKKLLCTWVIVVHIIATVSLLQFLGYSFIPSVHPGFYGATIGNPNLLANLIATTIILIVGYGITSCKYQYFWGISGIFLCIVLFITGSRGAFLGLVGGFIVFLLLQFDQRKKILFLLTGFLALSFLPVFQNKSLWYKEDFSKYGSTMERVMIWNSCWQTLKQNPLGYGFDQWQKQAWNNKRHFIEQHPNKEYKKYAKNRYFTYAHNDYLEMCLHLGWIGGVAFLWLIVLIIRMFYVNLAKSTEKIIYSAHFAALIIILIHSLVSFPLQTPIGSITFVLNCFWLSEVEEGSQNNFTTTKENKWAILLLFFLFLCITTSNAVSHLI